MDHLSKDRMTYRPRGMGKGFWHRLTLKAVGEFHVHMGPAAEG